MIWKSTTAIFLLFMLSTSITNGQVLLPVKKSEFINEKQASKDEYKHIKDALKIYTKGIGFVSESLELLLEAHKVNQNNPELNYNIGVCYLISGPRDAALPFLYSAEEANADISQDIQFLLGLAYKYRNEFTKAIVHFKINNELIEQNNYKEQKELISIVEKHIQECRNGRQFFENIGLEEIELVDESVNSSFDDFNPQFFDDKLFFSSRRGMEEDNRSPNDQKYFEKLFSADLIGEDFDEISKEKDNLGSNVNFTLLTKYEENNYVCYNSNSGSGDLYLASKSKNKWKIDKSLKAINKKDSRESSASLTADGRELYFVSNRKDGFGDCDIYYCTKEDNGKWSKPMNIGGDINTEYDEGDVFVSADGSELYFSSNGHNTIGGYDIFKCKRHELGGWESPENMGVPINSADNDINFTKTLDGGFYFASERSGGNGGYDIYRNKTPDPVVQEVVAQIIEDEPIVEAKIIEAPINDIPEEKVEIPIDIPVIVAKTQSVGLTEVPMKQELVEEDFVYRVQIAACRKEMDSKELFKRYKGGDVIDHLFVEEWHKYTIGGFETFEKAAAYKDACGVSDAFVVLFKGGYRLGIAQRPIGTN